MEIFKLFGSVLIDNDQANKKLDETDKKGFSVGQSLGNMASIAGKAALSLGAIGVAALSALGVKSVTAADSMKKALNGLQSETGIADEMMSGMRDTMLEIYKNNFGESFEDIGNSMATISQQTGAAGDELKNMTQNAIALRDTFEFEVNESVRSAKMLMDQFGVSGDEAYNLIAQGAQWGLDKNGDLLDTINEYSVQFKQLGFNADEMFNMLANGAMNGTWSVDKLGDAVKEFGIRSKDGSKTTVEAFKTLGLNVQQISMDFAKGGDTGKQAFETVTTKLLEMKDPLLQNQTGVALFGTMWEDLGIAGIQALTSTEGEINKNIAAMQKINEIKYDSFGEAIAGIGRQLEAGFIIPIGEKILPYLNTFANWVSSNIPVIQNAFADTFGTISAVFDRVAGESAPFMQQAFDTLTTVVIPALQSAFNGFMTVIGEVVEYLKNWFAENQETVESVKALFSTGMEYIKTVITTYIAAVTYIWNTYGEDFKRIVKTAWDFVMANFKTAIDLLTGMYKVFTALLKGDWQGAWDAIKETASKTWENIKNVFSKYIEMAKSIITLGLDVIKNAFSGVFNGIKGIVSGIFEGIVSNIKGSINTVIKAVNFMIQKINSIKIKIPEVDIPLVGKVGGKTIGLPNIKEIPLLAQGGHIQDNGAFIAGEAGPELISGMKGATVTPLNSGITLNFYDTKVMSDRDMDVFGERLVKRLKVLGVN